MAVQKVIFPAPLGEKTFRSITSCRKKYIKKLQIPCMEATRVLGVC